MTIEPPTRQRTSPAHPDRTLKHFRADAIVDAFIDAVTERWGSFKTRRNHTLIALVDALARHGTFAEGGRVAYPIAKLARRFRKNTRTVEDAVAKLREFPELVRVVRVEPGEPDWRGRRSRCLHLEWELGPALRSAVSGQACPHPGVTAAIPRPEAGASPGVTAPDPDSDLRLYLELPLKAEAAPERSNDRLNFEVQHPATSSPPFQPIAGEHAPKASSAVTVVPEVARTRTPAPPTPTSSALDEAVRSRRASDEAPPVAADRELPARSSEHSVHDWSGMRRANGGPRQRLPQPEALHLPLPLLDAIIRQHRAIAEGKGPYIPISDEERALVDGAVLPHRPSCRSDAELLALCARVSERGWRASRAPTATLRFVFGGPDAEPDNPHKFFHARVAELREADETADRQQLDSRLTSALLGRPSPESAPPLPRSARRSRPRLSPSGVLSRQSDRAQRLSPEATEAYIAEALARMDQPYPLSRAG